MRPQKSLRKSIFGGKDVSAVLEVCGWHIVKECKCLYPWKEIPFLPRQQGRKQGSLCILLLTEDKASEGI